MAVYKVLFTCAITVEAADAAEAVRLASQMRPDPVPNFDWMEDRDVEVHLAEYVN